MKLPFLLKSLLITSAIASASMLSAAPTVLDLRHTDCDTTIVLPESFETDTRKMMENWYLANYTALDADVDRTPDADATDEEIIQRLAAIPTTIELPYNSIVRAYIDAYTKRNRRLVENMLGMSLYYMPIFEQALENEGLPQELKYLPIIESAMNPDAVSRAGATGLWQLMLPTARGLGMEVNTLVDERRDPVVSSREAARYLRQLYEIYNDWSLAIAAYNCGPGNVNKALRRCTADKKDFWSVYPYLPKETRGYLPGFIAATYVMNNYKHHNISPALAKRPIITDSVHVNRRIYFQQIADVLQMPVEEIKVLNPQYRQGCIPGDIRPYSLVLPSNQIYSYILSEDAISNHNADLYARRYTVEPASAATAAENAEGEWVTTEKVIYHKVKRNESMSKIAKHYGVSLSSLRRANGNIRSPKRGQKLKVVTTQRVFRPAPKEETPEETPQQMPETNDVQLADASTGADGSDATEAADTKDVEAIASDAAAASTSTDAGTVTTEASSEATSAHVSSAFSKSKENAQKAEKTAQKAEKSAKSKKNKEASAKKSKKTVTVRKGDSLDRIARKNGTTVAQLKKLNGLSGRNPKIQPGQKLRVK